MPIPKENQLVEKSALSKEELGTQEEFVTASGLV